MVSSNGVEIVENGRKDNVAILTLWWLYLGIVELLLLFVSYGVLLCVFPVYELWINQCNTLLDFWVLWQLQW